MGTPHKLINPNFHTIKITGIVILRILQCKYAKSFVEPQLNTKNSDPANEK